MPPIRSRFKRLYWQIALVFLVLLSAMGMLSLLVTFNVFNHFREESEQRMNWDIAAEQSEKIRPYLGPVVDVAAIERSFHELSRSNPRATAFLVTADGRIAVQFLEDRELERRSISIDPLKQFIRSNPVTSPAIFGQDPTDFNRDRLFSAAPVVFYGKPAYVYVVFGHRSFDTMFGWYQAFYLLRSLAIGSVLALAGTAATGLILFSILTARFRKLASVVLAFQSGEYNSRVSIQSDDEVDQLGMVFNRMADTIQASIRELEHNDELRRNLVANVSHDLRGPLTSIQGFLQMLQMEHSSMLDARGRHFVEVIAKNVGHLGKLANELFELSKLEAPDYQPSIDAFSLEDLVRDVLLKFEPQAKEKEITLSVVAAARLPSIAADEHMVERILANLISNAIRHTANGGSVSVLVSEKDKHLVTEVRDTGCGIPADAIPYLFDRFYRVEKDRSRKSGGSGLGLAIVKRIVESHGGIVQVLSEVGKGSSFVFSLPLPAVSPLSSNSSLPAIPVPQVPSF